MGAVTVELPAKTTESAAPHWLALTTCAPHSLAKGSQIAAGGGCRHRVAEGVAVHLDEYVDVGKLGIGFEMAVEEHGDVAVRELDDGHDVAFE